MSQTRRLAAILAADVAGYLRLRMITAKHLCPERHVTRSVVTIVNADALELGDCLTRCYRRSPPCSLKIEICLRRHPTSLRKQFRPVPRSA